MSGICGIFQLDGSPVDPVDLQKMIDGMAHWGPDGRSQIISGPIGLGQLLLHNTPQAHLEHLPRQTPSGLLFTAEARLDNRADLFHQFQIPTAEQETTTDSQLIELAYEKWGENCPDQLLGDWSFAIWNPQTQTLFVARDHYGNTALYYYKDEKRFLFASSRDAILALGIPRRLNELYLAQVLVNWPAFERERTIDLDIYRLPSAQAMQITTGQTKIWRYWQLEDAPILHLPTFEEYVAEFLEIYAEAVNCRLRSARPVASTLSGGLDSGSVTALAARALLPENKRLIAYTAVPLHDVTNSVGPNRFGNETQLAQATARHQANIDHYLLNSSHISPIEGIQRILSLRNEPDPSGANFYWVADILQTAQNQGVGTLLTGQGGNGTVSWSGAPQLTSLRHIWQKRTWKAAIKPKLPLFARKAIHRRQIKRNNWAGSPIHPDFAWQIDLAALQIAAIGKGHDMPESIRTPRQYRYHIILPEGALMGAIWAEIGAGFGLEVRDPTLDKRVLAYTFSIPNHHFIGSNGQDRRLIRAAIAGLLPDNVRLNTLRGRQSADIGHRLINSGAQVEELLARLRCSTTTNYCDLDKMQTAWQQLQNEYSNPNSLQAAAILLRGVNAGLFLLNFRK